MTNTQAVSSRTVTADMATSSSETTPPAPPASLLVAPPTGAQALDPLSTIYLLQSIDREVNLQSGKDDVESKQKERDQALQQEIDQIKKAADAAGQHSFWDDVGKACLTVAKVAAVVGSVAIAVASCGAGAAVAALAIVACVMSTAGFAEGQLHVLERLGVDSGTAGAIGLGLSIGGLAASCGASLLTSSAQVGSEAATAGQQVADTTGRVAGCVSAGGTIAGGVAKVESSQYDGEAQDRSADALAAQRRSFVLEQQIQSFIDQLTDDDKSSQRQLGHVRGAMEATSESLGAAVVARA